MGKAPKWIAGCVSIYTAYLVIPEQFSTETIMGVYTTPSATSCSTPSYDSSSCSGNVELRRMIIEPSPWKRLCLWVRRHAPCCEDSNADYGLGVKVCGGPKILHRLATCRYQARDTPNTHVNIFVANFYSSQMKHPSTAVPHSRHASTNSFSTSVGPNGARPPSSMGYPRPKTSMSNNAPTGIRGRANTTRSRPNTAMGNHMTDEEATTGRQQNCMPPPSSFRHSTQSSVDSMHYRKLRNASSLHDLDSQHLAPRSRDSSLSIRMQGLNIKDDNPINMHPIRNQVVSIPPVRTEGHSRQLNGRLEHVTLRHGSRNETGSQALVRKKESRASLVAQPKTPPRTAQHALRLVEEFGDKLTSVVKTPRSPVKSPSSISLSFLTKESNTRTFTAWDVDERLSELDTQFKVMKEVMNTSLSDRTAMDEAIRLAKTRGRSNTRQGSSIIQSELIVSQQTTSNENVTNLARGIRCSNLR